MAVASVTAPDARQAVRNPQERTKVLPSAQSLVSRIDRHAAGTSAIWWFPHQQAQLDLRALNRRAAACAHHLTEFGICRGDRVGLALSNGPVYVILLIALWRLNAVPVPLRPHGGRGFGYESYLEAAEAVCGFQCVIHEAGNLDALFANWSARSRKPVFPSCRFAELSEAGPSPSHASVRRDDIALLQFTSGSTSDPKAVIVTHGMMMRQLEYLSECQVYYAGGRLGSAASWLPISHDMGLFTGVLLPLYEGARNLLAPPCYYVRNPRRWFALLGVAGAELNFATNSSMAAACDALSRRGYPLETDLSGLHLYFGAEKVSATVLHRAAELLGKLGLPPDHMHVGYGMAENALTATRTPRGIIRQVSIVIGSDGAVTLTTPNAVGAQPVVSVGEPLDGYELGICDARGVHLSELRLGEISVEGPCLTPGYFRNSAATRKSLSSHRLRTGDLGFMLDGELFFVGRRDDLINVGGRKLVPDEVEQTAENLEFVGPGRTCLLGMEDANRGLNYPLLLVESAGELSLETARTRTARIREALLDRHDVLISKIVFCAKGAVEKTPSGKKRRRLIKLRYLTGQIGRQHDYGYAAAV